MIEIRYKCTCMPAEVGVSVIPRDPRRDVVEWLKQIVEPTLSYDHATRSPHCRRRSMEYAKVPIDPATDQVGARTKPS